MKTEKVESEMTIDEQIAHMDEFDAYWDNVSSKVQKLRGVY